MIRHNGKWKNQQGNEVGEGLYFHYRRFQEIAWPHKIWESGPYKNYWAEKCLEVYLSHTYIGVMGAAAAGKSDSFACNALTDWYCWDDCSTVLVSSTDTIAWAVRYVQWELDLLAEIGFGLDLERCAVSGDKAGLAFVSPNSGRAVTARAAEPWRERLLPLPAFLSGGAADLPAIAQGLALTGSFLERHVFRSEPPARVRLVARLQRA